MDSQGPGKRRTVGYFPVYLDLHDKTCVVIGTNHEAERKVQQLLDAGARLTVVTEEPVALVVELARDGRLRLLRRPYQEGDLKGAFLTIALTTHDEPLSKRIAAEAKREGVLLNVADVTHLCDWIAPAVVRRGNLTAAISTNGLSPAMARFARNVVDEALPEEYGLLLEIVADVRRRLRRDGLVPDPEAWQRAIGEETLAALSEDDTQDIGGRIERKLRDSLALERAS